MAGCGPLIWRCGPLRVPQRGLTGGLGGGCANPKKLVVTPHFFRYFPGFSTKKLRVTVSGPR